jgi:hypothetical protein
MISMGRHFDEAFRLLGLTHRQFSLLMSLNRPAPAGMKDAADLLARERRRAALEKSAEALDFFGNRVHVRAAEQALIGVILAASRDPMWARSHAATSRGTRS